MTTKQKSIALVLSFALLVILFTGFSKSEANVSTKKSADLPINYLHATFSINVDDLKAVVGDADYVFVGYVDQLLGTEYKNPVTLDTENGTKTVSSPYTNYSITVLDNIKGELQKEVSNPVQKSGGLSEDGASVILYENDSLPEANKTYIFLAYAQPDGSLLVSGPKSNVPVEVSSDVSKRSAVDVAETNEYQIYVEAEKNEITTNRERFVSKYDTKQN